MCQTIQWLLGFVSIQAKEWLPPDTVYPLRYHSEIVRNAEAKQKPAHLNDKLSRFCTCRLHACSVGRCNTMASWFNSANHKEPYYLGRKSAEIDSELLKQTPPHEFSRPPRSIQKHWKASELRTWHSLPVLLVSYHVGRSMLLTHRFLCLTSRTVWW